MSMADPPREDHDLLAAELAFGLLDGDDRRAAEYQLNEDTDFAAAFNRWQVRAVALLTEVDEPPSPSLWASLSARLPANDVVPAVVPMALRRWQLGTLVASTAAVLLGIVAIERSQPAPTPPFREQSAAPPLVAMLGGKDKTVVAVSYDRGSGRLTSAPIGLSLVGREPELWVIPADGKPRSLGVIAATAPRSALVPASAVSLLTVGATMAISIEPIGGSPTGQPTGPVIVTGKLQAS